MARSSGKVWSSAKVAETDVKVVYGVAILDW